MNIRIQKFINTANAKLGTRYTINDLELTKFCLDEDSCNYCARLVYEGIKTATCSLAYYYNFLQSPEPKINDVWLVQDWNDNPIALVKVISSQRSKFADITTEFAYKEGEGDRTLDYWRAEHRKFLTLELTKFAIDFNENIELSLQEFKLIYKNT